MDVDTFLRTGGNKRSIKGTAWSSVRNLNPAAFLIVPSKTEDKASFHRPSPEQVSGRNWGLKRQGQESRKPGNQLPWQGWVCVLRLLHRPRGVWSPSSLPDDNHTLALAQAEARTRPVGLSIPSKSLSAQMDLFH